MYYIKKNKKKTHTGLISALDHIPPATRDQLLMKYIQQCKLTHALSFFQWRYAKLQDTNHPEMAKENKKLFYDRIEAMHAYIDYSSSLKAGIEEESRQTQKKKHKRKKPIPEAATEQNKQSPFFAFLMMNKKDKIDSFQMVGMIDPDD